MTQPQLELDLEVQRISRRPGPEDQQIRLWLQEALCDSGPGAQSPLRARLCVRLVDCEEMAELNLRHRKRTGSANVLSFPATGPEAGGWRHLGDIAACAPVIEREAQELEREPQAHWAHLLVHSALHLRGYTHDAEEEAQKMEARETAILRKLGFPPPYG